MGAWGIVSRIGAFAMALTLRCSWAIIATAMLPLSCGCSCTCSSHTPSGFVVNCVSLPSTRFEVLLYETAQSARPFALMEGAARESERTSSSNLVTNATAVASFQGLLLPGTRYWVRAAAHNLSQGADISHGWLKPCTPVPV